MKRFQAPPKIALRILEFLLPDKDREILIGDFSEEHIARQKSSTILNANIWYWKELLLSAPIYISFKIRPSKFRRHLMKISPFIRPGKMSAIWSMLFLLPATLLTIPGLIQSISGSDQLYDFLRQRLTFGEISLWDGLIHPAAVVFGLIIALLISVFSIIGLSFTNEEESLLGTLTMKKSTWNLFPLFLVLSFGIIIILYLIAENFGPFN